MRYSLFNPSPNPANGEINAVMVDLLNAYINGELDHDPSQAFPTYVNEGGTAVHGNEMLNSLVIETDTVPANGATALRFKYETTQDDKSINFPLEGKCKAGNLLIIMKIYADMDAPTVKGSYAQAMGQLENALDQVTDDWSATFFTPLIEAPASTSNTDAGEVTFSSSTQKIFFGIGRLKDTQTESYNPLDQLGDFHVLMADQQKAAEKADAATIASESTKD